jgi:hypothetical protein
MTTKEKHHEKTRQPSNIGRNYERGKEKTSQEDPSNIPACMYGAWDRHYLRTGSDVPKPIAVLENHYLKPYYGQLFSLEHL